MSLDTLIFGGMFGILGIFGIISYTSRRSVNGEKKALFAIAGILVLASFYNKTMPELNDDTLVTSEKMKVLEKLESSRGKSRFSAGITKRTLILGNNNKEISVEVSGKAYREFDEGDILLYEQHSGKRKILNTTVEMDNFVKP